MKYVYSYILPLALMGCLACSSEEVIYNPDYDSETQTVKAEVAISIGKGSSAAKTRMTDNVTQMDDGFRGIDDYIIYSANESVTGYSWCPVSSGTNLLGSSDSKVKTFRNVRIPIGTDHFLFYGRAAGGRPTTVAEKQSNGYAIATQPDAIISEDNIQFEAVQIAPNYATDAGWTTPAGAIETYLTNIARTAGWESATNNRLIELRNKFEEKDHFNAGSAPEVLATVQDLYNELCIVRGSASGDQLTLTDAIINSIKNDTYVTCETGTEPVTLDWASSFKSDYDNFPENIGLPQGSAQYEYKNRGTAEAPDWGFKYNTEKTVNSEATAVSDYIYPCELYYTTHTPLRAFSSKNIDWPETASDWEATASSSAWTNESSEISENTKSVALVNIIQYGTAQLATYVKSSPATLNSKAVLYDNQKAVDEMSAVNQPIDFSSDCLKLTGVIVGGQPNRVGWNFLPVSDATYNYAVYDNNMTKVIYANEDNGIETSSPDREDGFSGPNRTLVFDNGGEFGATAIVKVCLEFENLTGRDFFGKDGIIKNGKKFYLVGELNPAQASGSLPSGVEKRVFIQDYVTKAHFTIAAGNSEVAGSLGKAYSTIPDLRTTTQELGLSVSLQWEKGLEFKNHPLGGS